MSFVVRRVGMSALTLLLITAITFAITNLLPGDVATMIMGTQSNPEALAGLRERLGLNDPLPVQYLRWIGGLLTGDWGVSLRFGEPIADLLAQKAAASAMPITCSPSASALAALGEPSRSATATCRAPESRRFSAWAWPWLP